MYWKEVQHLTDLLNYHFLMRQNLGVLLRILLALTPDLTPTSMTPRVLHHHRELQHFRLINHFGKILMTTWQKENQQHYVPPVCCGQIWDVIAIHSSHPYSLDNAEENYQLREPWSWRMIRL